MGADTKSLRSFSYTGMISDNFPMFLIIPAAGETINVDLEKITIINSIGVKHWITWTVKLPSNSMVVLHNCPFVLVNQASTVSGFLSKNLQVESFFAYFVCPNCNQESSFKMENRKHYWLSGPEKGNYVFPKDLMCRKCNVALEPDFFPEKSLTFLKKY